MLLMDERMPHNGSNPTFPNAVRPEVANVPRSIWDSIRDRISSLKHGVGAVASGAAERMMPVPAGMEGMLSPEQVTQARRSGLLAMGGAMLESSGAPAGGGMTPTFAQALGRGVGAAQGAYGAGIEGSLQTAQAMKGMKEKDRIAAFRNGLAQKYPITPGMPAQELQQALMGMYAEAVAGNDLEMAAKTAQVASSLANNPAIKPEGLKELDLGGKKLLYGENTGKINSQYGVTAKPTDGSTEANQAWQRQQDLFSRTNTMQTQFAQQTKQHETVANAVTTFNQLAPAAAQLNGQAQIGLVFSFMKLLDPGSTVREGEYATAANAASVPERIRNSYNKALMEGGPFLSEGQVNSYATQVKNISKGWQDQFDRVRNGFQERAKAWQINPDEVAIDYYAALRGAAGSTTGSGTKPPPTNK